MSVLLRLASAATLYTQERGCWDDASSRVVKEMAYSDPAAIGAVEPSRRCQHRA